MKSYSESVEGINAVAISHSVTAASAISDLANALPNSGGMVSWFIGDNDLSTFGYNLVLFGSGMKKYSEAVQDLDVFSIESSVGAVQSLVNVASSLSNSGGMVSWFTGDNDLGTFGYQLASFGRGMKSYSEAVSGVDVVSIDSSVGAAQSLIEVSNSLTKTGGLKDLWSGEADIGMFGAKLVPFGKGMKEYADAVSGIDSESVSNSTTAASALAKVTNNLTKTGGLKGLVSGEVDMAKFGDQLVPFGKGIKKYSDSVVGIDPTAIENSTGAAKAMVQVANSLTKTGGLAGLITGEVDLSKLGNQLAPFGKGMKKYSDSVVGIDALAISNSASAAKKLVNLLNSMTGLNTSGVNSFVTALNKLGEANVDAFVKAFSGASSKVSSAGANLIDALVKGIKSKQSSVTSTATSIIESLTKIISSKSGTVNKTGISLSECLINGIKSKQSAFTSTANSIIGKFVSGITSQTSKVSKAFTSSLSSAISNIRDYYRSFYNSGSYLVSGFANGISANTYKAAAKSKAMANAAANAARKALDEHSPSKVGYEIGDFFGVAFVNAIGDYAKKAYKAGSEMATYAKDGLGRAVSKIGDFFSGDIDTQPTIRPILDLSDVKSGAGTISELFNKKTTIGAMTNINAISSMMNRNNQNGETGEIVSAINKLRKDLGNIGNTSYNINGITYDDGSNISDAVRTLVRAARVERRI
jgi:hypothetical protein